MERGEPGNTNRKRNKHRHESELARTKYLQNPNAAMKLGLEL